MDKDFTRSDHDLMEVLYRARANELLVLVSMLRKAMSCYLSPSCLDPLVIADELQLLGGNTLVNVPRGHGVKYAEILTDVASNVGAEIDSADSIAEREWLLCLFLLEKARGKLGKEDGRALDEQLQEALGIGGDADPWHILRDESVNDHVKLELMESIVRSLVQGEDMAESSSFVSFMSSFGGGAGFVGLGGPLGAVLGVALGAVLGGILNTTIYLPGPAYKATVPAVPVIAYARARIAAETASAYVSETTSAKDTATGRNLEVANKVSYFCEPGVLADPRDILANRSSVPKEPGVYGWYFDSIPPKIPMADYIEIDGHDLLYVGITNTDMRRRILSEHLGRSAFASTLRLSLGCLLSESLGIKLQAKGSKSFWFGADGEEKLTDWMITHARVDFLSDPNPEDVEKQAFRSYGNLLPLNLKENTANPFHADLTDIRKHCKQAMR